MKDDGAVKGASRLSTDVRLWPYRYVILVRVAILALWLVSWEWLSNSDLVDGRFTGRPTDIFERLSELVRDSEFWSHLRSTLQATLIAFAIAVPLGTIAGIALGMMPNIDRVVSSFLVPFNTFPRVALVPLFILWFGLSQSAKVALAVSLVFFLLLFNARAGIRNVDPDITTVSRLLGLPRTHIAYKVILPASVPIIFAGMRVGLTYSLLGVVSSEMIASRRGLGQLVVFYGNRLDVSGIMSIIFVFILFAAIISQLFDVTERWLLRWQ